MLQDGSIFAESPSFNSYSTDNFAEIAAKICEEFVDDRVQLGLEPIRNADDEKDDQQEEETEEDEFEFSFLSGDGIVISADEIFANGQIRPVFPVFNRDPLLCSESGEDYLKKNSSLRKLFIREREEEDDVHLPGGSYCVWKPKQSVSSSSPDTCKKSKSNGSSSSQSATNTCVSKRWRFRDFLFRRSNSDGKDTFVFLTPSSTTNKLEEKVIVCEEKKQQQEGKVVGKGKLMTGAAASAQVSAHENHYVRNRALKENDRKNSYLPYRQDIVGFFTNVNGLNRNLHPF